MASPLNPGLHGTPAQNGSDLDEIDQLWRQMQQTSTLPSTAALEDLGLGPCENFADVPAPYPISQSWAYAPQPILGSPSPPSLTTGSLTESPLSLQYDFSLDMSSFDDSVPMMFPDLTEVSLDDLQWPMDTLHWTAAGPMCDAFSLSPPDDGLQNDDSFQDHAQPFPANLPGRSSASGTSPSRAEGSPYMPVVTLPSAHASSSSSSSSETLACPYCGVVLADRTKLKLHTNKHTKPFRCAAPRCAYATAEKKSLQRHMVAKARWDEDHRAAADTCGVREVRHFCPNARRGCTYATIREDNLKRHVSTCTTT